MGLANSYGQFCPVAMSSELLCNRWTLLIIRELLSGSTGFNEIRRGVPLMSRTLLSSRLKDLEDARLLRRVQVGSGRRAAYRLTAAGEALRAVVQSIGAWGQEWIEPELAVGDVDYGYLLWSLRKTVRRLPDMPKRFVARFDFIDAPEGHQLHWLLYDGDEIDICHSDPGNDIDVWIKCDLHTFTEIWMGWKTLSKAMEEGGFTIDGPPEFTDQPLRWLGHSTLAGVAKQPREERVKVK